MKEIPKITVSVHIDEKMFKRNINDDLSIDPDDLDESLINQASLYAYYSIRMQQMTALKAQAEFEYEKMMNTHIMVVREELIESNIKTTDRQVMAVVHSRPEVLAAKQEFLNRCADRDQFYALTRALEHKKDTLLSLAYKRRSEIEAIGMSVKRRSEIPQSGIEDE